MSNPNNQPDQRGRNIYNEDCLKIMRHLNDKSVDLVFTDPPYGIDIGKNKTVGGSNGKSKNAKMTDFGYSAWDETIPDKKYFDEMLRVSKNQIIFGGNYFVEYLTNSPCWLVWDKVNQNSPFADCELAWTSFGTAVRKFNFMWNGMLQGDMKSKEKRVHPTQKPLKLALAILEKYAKPGQTILDPFMGSGTFVVAAKMLGMNYIGVEKETEYFDLAQDRLTKIQLTLLTPTPTSGEKKGGKNL